MIQNDKAFSSIDFVGQCLVDIKRTVAFQKAINRIVKPGDNVVELGTGSGVMALTAAKAGATKVFAVEFDPFVAEIASNAINLNNLNEKIELILQDARKFDLPSNTKLDVVISEMLTTGMVDEPQIQSINNLHAKNLVDSSTKFIPSKQETQISLVNTNFKIFGFSIPMVLHLWNWHKWKVLKMEKLTDAQLLNSISFNVINKENFEKVLTFKIKKGGVINSVHLTSKTFLANNIYIHDTEALNAPMLIPIQERVVKNKEEIKIKVSYIFGGGYRFFKAQFI
jgi:predicted RNA methylase